MAPTTSQAYESVCPSSTSVAVAESVTSADIPDIWTDACDAEADVMTGGVLPAHSATSVMSSVTGVAKSNATPSLSHRTKANPVLVGGSGSASRLPSWIVTGAIVLAPSPQSNVTVRGTKPSRTKESALNVLRGPLASDSSSHVPFDGLYWRTTTVYVPAAGNATGTSQWSSPAKAWSSSEKTVPPLESATTKEREFPPFV